MPGQFYLFYILGLVRPQPMTAALIFRRQLVRPTQSLKLTASSSRVQAATHDHILMFPPPIFRSGVLRQGCDKFYSLSFQARRSFVRFFINP